MVDRELEIFWLASSAESSETLLNSRIPCKMASLHTSDFSKQNQANHKLTFWKHFWIAESLLKSIFTKKWFVQQNVANYKLTYIIYKTQPMPYKLSKILVQPFPNISLHYTKKHIQTFLGHLSTLQIWLILLHLGLHNLYSFFNGMHHSFSFGFLFGSRWGCRCCTMFSNRWGCWVQSIHFPSAYISNSCSTS